MLILLLGRPEDHAAVGQRITEIVPRTQLLDMRQPALDFGGQGDYEMLLQWGYRQGNEYWIQRAVDKAADLLMKPKFPKYGGSVCISLVELVVITNGRNRSEAVYVEKQHGTVWQTGRAFDDIRQVSVSTVEEALRTPRELPVPTEEVQGRPQVCAECGSRNIISQAADEVFHERWGCGDCGNWFSEPILKAAV